MQSEHTPDAAEMRDTRDRHGLLALAIYLTFSLVVFGRPLLGHFRDTYIGIGPDPSDYMWFFVWWPYALVHRLVPFFTDLIWAPGGANLTWLTGIPLPSLVMWPLTASLGPIAAYNILCVASLPLGAWSAFLLCRYVSRSWWAALLGGYVFGFSAYALQKQTCGQQNLTMVFLEPLAILLVARAIAGELASRRFIAAMAAVLVAQFLISVEVFATMITFGAMALLLGWSFGPPDTGRRIARTLMPLAAASAIAVFIVSPYLYSMFAFGVPRGPVWTLESFSSDLLNFVVPSTANQLGVIPLVSRLSAQFGSGDCEASAYLGLPLIIIATVYAWQHWHEPTGKLLVDSLIIICVLAMGPVIHFRGAALMQSPGKILPMLPLLGKVLPARLMIHAFLVLAIITSIWFAESRLSLATNAALAVIVVISVLPNLSATYWTSPDDSPAFFSTALHRHYLEPGENVLVLPYGIRGNSMLWQAETGMYYRMVGGYAGPLLPEYKQWLIVNAFMNPSYVPDRGAELSAFMAHHAVSTIAVVDNDVSAKAWHTLASSCCVATVSVGGVTLYRAAPDVLAAYAAVSALRMEQRSDSVLFDTLLLAADRWLSDGNSLARLTPLEAQQKGLLPASWRTGPTAGGWSIQENPVTDPSRRYYLGAWLGPMADGHVSVGVYGSYAALESIVSRYRQRAVRVYFPYPASLAGSGADTRLKETHGLMVIEFDRDQLAAAAAQVRASASTTGLTTGAPALAVKAGQ